MKQYRLPKEFAEKWVKALRSGDYEQGHGHLYTRIENSYCCLGVACEVAGHRFIGDEGDNHYIDETFTIPAIPKEIMGDNDFTVLLAELNDETGFNFDEIADWIQRNVELYE